MSDYEEEETASEATDEVTEEDIGGPLFETQERVYVKGEDGVLHTGVVLQVYGQGGSDTAYRIALDSLLANGEHEAVFAESNLMAFSNEDDEEDDEGRRVSNVGSTVRRSTRGRRGRGRRGTRGRGSRGRGSRGATAGRKRGRGGRGSRRNSSRESELRADEETEEISGNDRKLLSFKNPEYFARIQKSRKTYKNLKQILNQENYSDLPLDFPTCLIFFNVLTHFAPRCIYSSSSKLYASKKVL
jgi:hypothetical protein